MDAQKWEYLYAVFGSSDERLKKENADANWSFKSTAPVIHEYLTQKGDAGWELVAANLSGDQWRVILKHPKEVSHASDRVGSERLQ